MLRKIIPLTLLVFIFSCSNSNTQDPDNKKISKNTYSDTLPQKQNANKKDEFSIIIVKNHMMNKIARNKAIEEAKKACREKGFLSFDTVSEQNVKVIIGKKDWPNAWDFPQNLYQEEIVEKGYNRDRYIEGSKPDYKVRDALKVNIKAYKGYDTGQYKVN